MPDLAAVAVFDPATCPYATDLDFSSTAGPSGSWSLSMPVTSALQGMPDTVHGMAIGALVDTACWMAASTALDSRHVYTRDLHVRYLQRVPLSLERIVAVGELVMTADRSAVTHATVVDDDGTVYAHATATFTTPSTRP